MPLCTEKQVCASKYISPLMPPAAIHTVRTLCLFLVPKDETSLAGQTLTQEESGQIPIRLWYCILSSSASNEVGVNINLDVFCIGRSCYYASLCKQHVKKGNRVPPFVTKSINMPRNSWRVRNEMMIGI